jgi:hypothetical protein
MGFLTDSDPVILSAAKNPRICTYPMTSAEFRQSLTAATPPASLTPPLAALWWDAKGDWAKAHSLVDDLETPDAMAVHAYLHRKEGAAGNADYWYARSTTAHRRPTLAAEFTALLAALLP